MKTNINIIIEDVLREYLGSNIIHEDRRQLTLPFDGKIHKYGYEDFIDYLESIGKYGKLSSCNDFDYENAFKGRVSLDEVLNEEDASICDIIYYCGLKLLRMNNVLEDDIRGYEEMLYNCDDPRKLYDYCVEVLTGYHLTEEIIYEVFEELVNDNPLGIKLDVDSDGLVEIERAIDLENLLEKYGNDEDDLYTQIMGNNDFSQGLGLCWTWSKGNAESYNGWKGDEIVIKGRVNPNDIDWHGTVWCNFIIPCEREIRLNENVPVEVDEIIITDLGKKFPLRSSIIVPSGSHI